MISIIGLNKQFGSHLVLKDIYIDVPDNSIYGITGSNGAGKSSLFNILGGLLKSDSGNIYINENELLSHNKNQSMQIGCVFEKPIYIEKLTGSEFLYFVGEMYNLPKSKILNKIDELLEFFDLTEHKNKNIESFSKGMKSKISLATSLIHSPKYLFLDEPFDGIDNESIKKIINLLIKISNNGSTVLISSHQDEYLAKMCNKILKLNNGILA